MTEPIEPTAQSLPIPEYDRKTTPVGGALEQQLRIPEEPAEQPHSDSDEETQGGTPPPDPRPYLEQMGIDFNALADEYAQLGGLSEDSYSKLEAAGISREITDQYIDGQIARAEKMRKEILSAAGTSEDEVKRWTAWAAHGFTPDEAAAFNQMIASSPGEAVVALSALRSRYEAINGRSPKRLVEGEGSGGSDGGGYSTREEMIDAIANPLYRKDERYRAEVQRRIAAMSERLW